MRKPREIYLNAEYHVAAKINRGEFAFESREVKELFLFIVKRAKKKYSFRLRDFVVMSNHIHFLIKPGEDVSLSRVMQWILSIFAVCYNKKFDLKGHVWQDRFKSKVIKSYRQLIATFKYICNNPVKVEMVETPKEYEYGGLWFIRNRQFDFIEPPEPFLIVLLPELFK
jgi:putative transposase